MAQLRVMTWNLQNLFEVGSDFGPRTNAEFNSKVASLATVIDDARPHVVAVQEVGSDRALRSLQEALEYPMKHRVLGASDSRGIAVGFLSTRTIRDAIDIAAFPPGLAPVQVGDDPQGPYAPPEMNEMARGALEITIRANNADVRIVTCHLKSKLLSFPGGRFFAYNEYERARFGAYALYRRASEATTIRVHLNAMLNDEGRREPVILCGDLNDETAAATTQIFNGPPGSEIGSIGFDRPDRGDGWRMFNLAPLVAEEDRYSRIYRGRRELIDHIFVSHFLAAENHTVSVETRTAIGALASIDDDPAETRGKPGSDHAALLATFDF